MTAPLTQDVVPHPPINFFYLHFHNSIRAELDGLSQAVLDLQPNGLLVLKERYRFLEQVYKYHSSVEDEVVYPALDSKVKNVTLAYSVEHEDEERLFEQLTQLLTSALAQTGKQRTGTLRQLACKVEEIHTTLRKHLAKEEEQLFPLLVQHFSYAEQAELVAQFLCSIPLADVEAVLTWLKRTVPRQEQEELLQQVRGVVPDHLLLQLMVAWLSPEGPDGGDVPLDIENAQPVPDEGCGLADCCRLQKPVQAGGKPGAALLGAGRSPLMDITHFHAAIRSALESFAAEARALQQCAELQPADLAALGEHHRFLRSVMMFHSASENEVLFPAARQLSASSCTGCEEEHMSEAQLFEEVGRLLGDVKACARRGAKEAAGLTEELCASADAVRVAVSGHMTREEREVLPVLQAHLCAAEQRAMVWRTLCAMPLRLLERVLPWVAGKLSDEEAGDMLRNMRLAAPSVDNVLVELLSRWAQRGRQPLPELQEAQGATPLPVGACVPHVHQVQPAQQITELGSHRPSKRLRTEQRFCSSAFPDLERTQSGAQASTSSSPTAARQPPSMPRINPIDHIFQFHKALRRDLRRMESDANSFAAALEEAVVWGGGQVTQQLEGRFRFLWGIYRAHSQAEDEIVFPALESKETLHRVSHAYTLDHQQEEQLFRDVDQVFARIRGTKDLQELRVCAGQLQRMCAAMRAALEQHVRAEEQELWPLFAEHFSMAEQEHLVGMIIGRTGAEVLGAMLPWITGSFTEEEQRAMMESLRSATKNTMFEQWLDATMRPTPGPAASHTMQSDASCERPLLADVAEYLARSCSSVDPGSPETVFRPGWEDIFRMNQKQLEIAVRRIGGDKGLEPQRKAYLLQNIMASRYIVAQQKRLDSHLSAGLPGVVQQHKTYHDPVHQILGCQHYKRKARMVAPCCGRVYTCRHCHDEGEDHRLDPAAIQQMICMQCGTQQPVAGQCRQCHEELARYYCKICHLFDDEPGRHIYHCQFCNLCRLGQGLGKDACHCMECNSCMHLSEFVGHKCRAVSNCPVCTERLSDSSQPYRELPCGHFMHSHCFAQYSRYNYTCPICARSMGDMSVYFRMIDSLLARDDLPVEYASRRQDILCNDCGQKSQAPFHFVYHKCTGCGSYNTRVC